MTVLQRLRERKLIQWALAYAGGAWVVLEVFSTIQDGLGWPAILFPILLAALAVGFLVTLVLAWYHGEQGRQKVSGPELLIIGGILVVAGLLSSILLGRPAGSSPAGDSEPVAATADAEAGLDDSANPDDPSEGVRIAVLPLANRGDDEDRGFVDGIHDEILVTLSKIGSLAVLPPRSVLRYRDSPETAVSIGEELGARYVVDGSVQREDRQVRMRLTLTDTRADEIVWNGGYNRDLTVTDLLDVQRDVALNVASGVGARVLPAEAARLETDAPENLEAYDHYLVGLSFLRLITLGEGPYQGAISNFEAAIAAEPEWAPPRAALGAVYHWMASRGMEAEVNYPRSKASLDAALAIDSLNAPAWASLGLVRHWWEGDFVGSEAAYANARELGHNAAWERALLLWSWGRLDEATSEFERYLSLDPDSPITRLHYGAALLCDGRSEAAIPELERAIGLDRISVTAWLAEAYMKSGREEEGLRLVREMEQAGVGPEWLAYGYALAGLRQEAAELRDRASSRPPTGRSPGYTAAAALLLGERDRALDFLEEQARSHPLRTLYLHCPEEMRILRGDPRYERILDQLGYPPLRPSTGQ